MATRLTPPKPTVTSSTHYKQYGHIRSLQNILKDPHTGSSNSRDILQYGHWFFYVRKVSKYSFTYYGMCSIAKMYGKISLVLFNNPEDRISLPLDDTNYTFYSEISLVPHDCLNPLESEIQTTFNKCDRTLLNPLVKRNWVNTFPSLSAFLAFLLSLPISNEIIVNALLTEGAELFISEENKIKKHLLVKIFKLGYLSINKTVELVISIDLPKDRVYSYTTYSFVFFLNNLKQCQKIQSKELKHSEVELRNLLQQKFCQILELGCIEVLDYIFDAKNNLLNKSDNQSNLIHIAAIKSSPEIFEYILTDFNNWEIADEKYNNLLHTCISHKMYDNLYILMTKISLPILNRLLFAKNGENLTPFKAMMHEPNTQLSIELAIDKGCHDENENNFIHLAIMNRDLTFLKSILKKNFEDFLFTHRNKLGRTPIQLAIENREVQAVSILLKYSVVSLPSQDCNGCNSLHTAIIYYNHEIFESLMKSVIDFDRNHDKKLINSTIKLNSPIYSNSALTPVLLSIRENQFKATQLLLSNGARLDLQDGTNQSFPYYIQSYCTNLPAIQSILQTKIATENIIPPCSEIQDLEYAADPLVFYFYKVCSSEKLIMILDAFSNKNIIKQDKEGNTILLLALKSRNNSLVKYLLDHFTGSGNAIPRDLTSDFINTKNKIGETALFIAVNESELNLFKFLLNMGASIEIEYPGGNTILHTAITTRNHEILQILLSLPKIGQLYCKENDQGEIPIISLMKIEGVGTFDAINKGQGTSLRGPNGESILHLVVKNGDKETLDKICNFPNVKSLLTVRDNEGQTPLHYAVIFTKIYAIGILIRLGLKLSEPDNRNKSPIHYAIDGKNVEVWNAIMGILSKHPNVQEFIDQKNQSGLTLLQYSIECNFLFAVKDILSLHPNLLPSHPENNTIVHLAAKSSEKAETLNYLLDFIKKEHLLEEIREKLLQSKNREQLPPLHYAIYNNNIEGVRILLEQGLSIVASFKGELSFFSGKLKDKLTLYRTRDPKPNYLFGYIIIGQTGTALVLTEIPSLQSTKIFPETSVQKVNSIAEELVPLFLQTSCCDIINYLVQHKIIGNPFSSGRTLLHYAAQYSSENILSYLTTNHRLPPVVFDKQNDSLLYYALQNKNPHVLGKVCELLKSEKKQNNPFETANFEGKRILEICLAFDNLQGFLTILPYISDLIYSNANKLTLLYIIIRSNQGERFIAPFINSLIGRYRTHKLCEYADTLISVDKLTSLHCSIQKSNVEIVKSVLGLDPNLSITTLKGYNALHLAAYIGNASIITLLLHYNTKDKSAKHNLVDSLTNNKYAMTPLHISVFKGNSEVLDILLLNKAQPTIPNADGETPLHYAVSCTTIPEKSLKLIITALLLHPGILFIQDDKGQTPVFCSIIESNLTVLTMFLEHLTVIDINHKDKSGRNIIQHSIECKNREIWKTLFNYRIKIDFFAKPSIRSTFNLIDSISLCMNNDNELAFNNLLGLKPQIPISDQDWNKLIESSISQTDRNIYLASIIRHLKSIQPNNWKDTYFYREISPPPLILAIQRGNIKAIETMLIEQISLSFLDTNKQLNISSRANPESLVLCKKIPSLLLIGYKLSISHTTQYKYLLVDLPRLDNTKLYSSREISLLQTLAPVDIKTILRSPSIEPINRVLLSSSPTLKIDGECELIHLAAQYGSNEIIQHWLFKQNLDKLDKDKNSILYYALLHQNPNIFQTICNQMVQEKLYQLFNLQNVFGNRILDICVRRNKFESFCLLLDTKYNVELNYIDSKGYYLLHRIILLKSDVKFFIKLHSVLRLTDLIGKAAGPSNLTHLHLAIVEQLPDYIMFMLENQYNLCAKSKGGNLPLHLAILYNFGEEILNLILNAIPKDKLSNCLNAQNNQGHTPLHLAAQNGNANNTELLLSKGCIRKEITDNLQRTALHYAVLLKGENFDPRLIHLLLNDTDLHNYKDTYGRTPVHYCIIENNLKALEAVFKLKKAKIDINDKDNGGKNIFHFAIENKFIPIWDLIFAELKVCPHSQSIIDDTLDNKTLLVHCIMHNNISAFKDILSLMPNTNTFDSQDNTPLHHACTSSEQINLLNSLQEHFEKFHKERIKEIFCYQNKENLTPLHFAINNKNVTAVRTLLKSKSPFVFMNKQQQQTLCALNSPLSLKLCQHRTNKNLMIGYAIVLENKQTCWILTKIPEMGSEAVEYEDSEITEIATINRAALKTILECPSSEPLIAFFIRKLISKDFHNLLHFAANYGSLEVVTELCKTINIFSPDSNGDSVLFYALKNPKASILDFLINKIIELNKSKLPCVDLLNVANKVTGKRLLEVALEMNNYDAFTVLLKTEFNIELTYKDANGCTLLLKIVQYHKYAKYLTSLLSEIRDREPNNLCTYVDFRTSGSSNTALHNCISGNLEECLSSLLKFSPNMSCENSEGNSPLHLASKDNYLSFIRILIDRVKELGGDLKSFINAVNSEKLTPLHYSIIQFNSDIVMLLLTEGANLYAVNTSGKSVLHLAVGIEKIETRRKAIEFLLNYERENPDMDSSLVRVQDNSRHTPLHLAVIRNKIEATQILLGESHDLTIADKDEMTVLHHSIRNNHSKIFDKILEAIPSTNSNDPLHVLNLKDKEGDSAINLAINLGLETCIAALLKLNPLLNLKNNSGQTPLHLSVLKPLKVLNWILEKIGENSEKVIYLNATNNEGLPPLHFAIQKNRLESVEKLIEFGANLFFTDEKGFTTLYNGKGGLSLYFSKAKKAWYGYFSKDTIFVGYKMGKMGCEKGKGVVTNLPELNATTIVMESDVEEFTKLMSDANILNIVKCACTEPIEVAIQNNLVNKDREEGKGKWLNNLASKDGHKNVINYLCNNLPIETLCEMIKSGVTNIDTFGGILKFIPPQHSYRNIPKLTDFPTEEEKLIYNISNTLCDTMLLSLDNPTPDALTKLLSLNPCLNFLYTEGKSTLLHLMIEKKKTIDFLEIFLNKVGETKPENQEFVTVNGVRIIDAKNGSSMTALSLSIKLGQEENIKILLKFKPDLTLCDGLKNSILHFAAKTKNVDVMDLIIAEIIKSPELIYLFNEPNSDGCIPLHISTETGHIAIWGHLLENGSEFYSRDNELRSVLHHAILVDTEIGRTSMIELILNNAKNDKNTNNIVEIEDKHGQLPIHYAVNRKCLASLKLLIPYTSTIKNRDAQGKTILHLTSMHPNVSNTDIISCILTEISKQEENNPNSEWVTDRVINFQDNCKKTPLHLCIDNRNHACLEELLAANPSLELVDAKGNTLLHTAVEIVDSTRYLESVLLKIPSKHLRNFFARLNSHGLPPLQYAILKNNYLAAEVLVKKEANLAFHSDGKLFICAENKLLSLQIVDYKGHSWAGFRITHSNRECLIITDLPELTGTIFLKQNEVRYTKPYSKSNKLITEAIMEISKCKSCDPINYAIQEGLITADTKLSGGLQIAPLISKHGTKEVLKKFYEIHKDTLYFEKSGNSMIESAVENPNTESLELLLSFLPNSTQPNEEISSCVKNSLKLCLKNPNTNALKALLDYSKKVNYLYTEDNLTLLHLAIQEKCSTDLSNAIFNKVNSEGTQSVFENVLFINKQTKTSNQTALHTCIKLKKKETLDVLLSHSPDIFICDVDGNTALHFAVLHTQDLTFVETLYDFTDDKHKLLNIRNNSRHTALHLAVIGGNLEIVEFLLRAEADFYPQASNEPTLLHLAINIENDSTRGDVIKALLPYKKQDGQCEMTQLKDNQGYPPLHLAVRLRTKNAVKLLLEADPSVLSLKNEAGHTPLHISLIPQKIESGSTLPYCEVVFNEVLGVIMSCSGCDICTTCQVNNIICTQDKRKRTAMHYAIQENNVKALKTLLEKKTCLNIPDEHGNILLHEAVLDINDISCLKLVTEELELRYKDDNFLGCFKF